ncbi:glycosyltransferase involved in cell wall biosynthesis [Rhodobium orientis]|uniref:Glucosyl transferase n=1 Tax=Rhodobium orientis TaxID=34017 RepID=A0A327JKF0_9HYPH|nr:glycosyltransferase [Rhodobium orientis]MBB4303167.1 glycosyltransferase involved in cell wall biosynthesis [Rhodobium orientis]MBK5951732.1 glucosyl transferase [Rhodobium orientis]RAI26910.1 glucosyl transferase [Rhodobium orientis]
MNRTPVATVVVPAYNCQATIAETLRSILNQTFTDLELIVVDDGSKDATVDVIRDFGDERIRLIRQQNRGLAGAHNTGIHHARGRYVAFCDADDLWLPEKLELHIAHMDARPEVGISFSGSALIDQHGRPLGISQQPKLRDITAADVFKRNPIGNGSTPVMRREALDAIAFRPVGETERDWWFDETFRQSDDIEGWLRFILSADWLIEGIPGDLTLYRIHTGALSANVEAQFATWCRMKDKIAAISPMLVRKHGATAEAYQLRYLARRAVSSRDSKRAAGLMRRSLGTSPRPLVEEPVKTVVTLAAAELLSLLGQNIYGRIESRLLSRKAA